MPEYFDPSFFICEGKGVDTRTHEKQNRLIYLHEVPENKNVIVTTYSMAYFKTSNPLAQLKLNRKNFFFVYNSKFETEAEELHRLIPNATFLPRRNFHAKMILVEPDEVWLGSSNIGNSNWLDTDIRLKNAKAYYFYLWKLREEMPFTLNEMLGIKGNADEIYKSQDTEKCTNTLLFPPDLSAYHDKAVLLPDKFCYFCGNNNTLEKNSSPYEFICHYCNRRSLIIEDGFVDFDHSHSKDSQGFWISPYKYEIKKDNRKALL